MTATTRKLRTKKEAARLAVLEEFGFAMASEPAKKIADALIKAREDSARVDYFERQLRSGNEVFLSREIDEENELSCMIWVGEKDEGTPWVAGRPKFRDAIDDAIEEQDKPTTRT